MFITSLNLHEGPTVFLLEERVRSGLTTLLSGHGSQRYMMTAMLKKNVRHSYTATSGMAHLLLPTHGHYPVDQ
jgi:hypothetical protein